MRENIRGTPFKVRNRRIHEWRWGKQSCLNNDGSSSWHYGSISIRQPSYQVLWKTSPLAFSSYVHTVHSGTYPTSNWSDWSNLSSKDLITSYDIISLPNRNRPVDHRWTIHQLKVPFVFSTSMNPPTSSQGRLGLSSTVHRWLIHKLGCFSPQRPGMSLTPAV